jgi:hypothetical protein
MEKKGIGYLHYEFGVETADFLMLLKPSGDGYSLLCSKNSLRGTICVKLLKNGR